MKYSNSRRQRARLTAQSTTSSMLDLSNLENKVERQRSKHPAVLRQLRPPFLHAFLLVDPHQASREHRHGGKGHLRRFQRRRRRRSRQRRWKRASIGTSNWEGQRGRTRCWGSCVCQTGRRRDAGGRESRWRDAGGGESRRRGQRLWTTELVGRPGAVGERRIRMRRSIVGSIQGHHAARFGWSTGWISNRDAGSALFILAHPMPHARIHTQFFRAFRACTPPFPVHLVTYPV